VKEVSKYENINNETSALLLLLSFFSVGAECVSRSKALVTKDESLRQGETRATLDPAQFSDVRAKASYKVAKEIPWVLDDSIYCFCMCKESPAFSIKAC
jgi:hypothetical protein